MTSKIIVNYCRLTQEIYLNSLFTIELFELNVHWLNGKVIAEKLNNNGELWCSRKIYSTVQEKYYRNHIILYRLGDITQYHYCIHFEQIFSSNGFFFKLKWFIWPVKSTVEIYEQFIDSTEFWVWKSFRSYPFL